MTMHRLFPIRTSLLGLFSLIAGWAAASALMPARTLAAEAQSCAADPMSRELDYWMGNWTVSYPGGPKGSTSKVERLLDQCLFVEQWGDRTGHRGENVFAYGKDDQTWHGLFADNRGRLHVFVEGKVAAGTAEFLGPSRGDDGATILNRVRVIRVDDDTLKQTWEKSVDSGRTWKPEFSLDYSRARR
jgi:hypothetical protein